MSFFIRSGLEFFIRFNFADLFFWGVFLISSTGSLFNYPSRKKIVLEHVLKSEKYTQYQLFPLAHATFGHDLPPFGDFPLAAENKIQFILIFDFNFIV